nr:hypothetical protein [Tanacetum cinerariifolium]
MSYIKASYAVHKVSRTCGKALSRQVLLLLPSSHFFPARNQLDQAFEGAKALSRQVLLLLPSSHFFPARNQLDQAFEEKRRRLSISNYEKQKARWSS